MCEFMGEGRALYRLKKRYCLQLLTAILLFVSWSCASERMLSDIDSVGDANETIECVEFRKLLDKTYNFKPSKLTDEQQSVKSKEMDAVWSAVDKDPKLMPCLRSEITQRKGDTFFRFNASNLLFKHDRSIETKNLLIETYSEADLTDINLRYWLPPMASLGFEGLDVSRVGETWLRYPNPEYYLPQHGTRPVNKPIGALALFGSMEESMATPALARLAAEETDFRAIVIWLLVSQATPESKEAAKKLSLKLASDKLTADLANPKLVEPRQGTPKVTREAFVKALNELLDGKPDGWVSLTTAVSDGERDMVVVFTEADLPLVRKARRHYAATATPHSPEWYASFTEIINTIQDRSSKSKAR